MCPFSLSCVGDNPVPVVFVLSKNLMVLVQIVEREYDSSLS